jgi:hypothetical protein
MAMGIGIKIDEQTKILYGNHVVDAKVVAKDYAEWEGARRVSANALLSKAPEDQLVLRDIFDSPIEIVRDVKHGNLILQASIVRREGGRRKFDRPYAAIALTPKTGQVASVGYLQDVCGGISFRLKEATPTRIVFDGIGNKNLEMSVDYQSR